MSFLTQNEAMIRLGIFVGVMVLMMVLEAVLPRKKRALPRGGRWFTNLGMIVIDSIALRLVFQLIIGAAAIGTAAFAQERGWGLLNLVDLPVWLEIVLAMLLLDMAIYWQHVAAHHFPILWMVHKVHHVDRDIDVTTGLRFHPIEIVLSMLYKMLLVLILGPAVVAVLLFELVLNACAMFNHSNLRLPLWLDKTVRLVLVTPDMHRVHHSIIVGETNSNYGFSLSWWDKIFGSYIDQPAEGHDGMVIGLAGEQTEKPAGLLWSLMFPFADMIKSKEKASS